MENDNTKGKTMLVKSLVVGQVVGCEKITSIKPLKATRHEVRSRQYGPRVVIIFKHIETNSLRADVYNLSDKLFILA